MPDGSECEIFSSPNYSKFAVECHQNRKISQTRSQFGYLGENVGFFEKKLEFFVIGEGSKFAGECVSIDIIFTILYFPPELKFCKKFRKSPLFENLQNLMKRFLPKSTLSSFEKASLTKLEGGKYAGCGRRVSCNISATNYPL